QKLIAGGALSPIVLDYIMDSEVPKPCRHFIGRDKELEELYTMLEETGMFFFAELPVLVKANLPKPTQNITKSITLTFYM
ncbi:Archaeal ATPase, partial [Blautia sp. OF11-22]